jgi:hypothetical protein
MVYSNTTVMLTVIAVVLCVLGIVFAATYCLNRAVDQSDGARNG